MNEPKPRDESESGQRADEKTGVTGSKSPAADERKPAKKLTPEEQMELYEKDLKESDWGHQPC